MRKYFIMTFGCSMNQADSEKVNMILLQSGFMRTQNMKEADLVIFNTCSVRQKGEDRVFGMIEEIKKINSENKKNGKSHEIKIGITGCMVRKTGLGEKYLDNYKRDRNKSKKINLLKDGSEIFNNDDKLFPRAKSFLDFTLRIEDIKFLPLMLTHIYSESIGNDAKFDDYLKSKQMRENPFSATIIIQSGCDNFCTFCIVPYTRGGEKSRTIEEIVEEAKEAVKNGAKEITLVGQNVNSYGKQFVDKKFWNEEKGKWNNNSLKIGIDLDDSLVKVWYQEIIENYNKNNGKNLKFEEILTHNFNGDDFLAKEFFDYYYKNGEKLELFEGAFDILKKLKEKGHELHIVTSRPKKDFDYTHNYLKNIFGEDFFESINFTFEFSEDDTKSDIANKLGLDIVIDDAPHHIERYFSETSAKIIIFSEPWNKKIEENSRIKRANSWEEIYKNIENFTKSPFRQLLEELDKIDGLDRIRFTSSNPHDMTDDILDAHFDLKKTCNYLHFALQSGNNKMLRRMNRRHKYEDFKRIVEYLRSKDPSFSISTDIIVGFSGETEEMFEDTIKAFDELNFDFAYNARYSVRTGTIAAKMFPDDISDEKKAERWHILNDKLLASILKRNEKMIGNIEEILVSGKKDEYFFGRTRNFKEVYFEAPEGKEVKIGDLVKVKLEELDRYIIKGKIV